ncbi:hypothetical protein HAX54_000438 [Datura stramonium]|uniref:TOG domain-containing protein n=1 Tax=Datura stramonium TaxID=4076 RepID=A0ABS8T1X8_DATST|nr:hypothetical protein [Datura stramonium]
MRQNFWVPTICTFQRLFQFLLSESTQLEMEAILGPDSEPFLTFLSDYTSRRSKGKRSIFNMMKQKDPNSIAIKLATFLGSSQRKIRRNCAVLLRKLLTEDDDSCTTWVNLSESTQSKIKCVLLDRIKLEESNTIFLELHHTVGKLAASLLPGNNWPEFLPFLYQCLTDSSPIHSLQVSALYIFSQLTKVVEEPILVPYVKRLHPVLLNTLNDDTLDLSLRIPAMMAVISFIQCISSPNVKERFQDLLPGMMKAMTDASSNGEEAAAQDALIYFTELAKNEPRFLRLQLAVVVGSILEIAEAERLEQRTRHLAILFLITLVEAKERAPGMVKKLPSFISRCFTMLLKLLLDIKDDPAWHTAETVDNDIWTESNYNVGAKGLELFSFALGGKSVAHIAKEQLSDYLAAPEWEKRHAALIALAQIARGCSKVMIKNLEQLMNMVLNCFQDPHPRVRWAACCAIRQLLIIFYPYLQDQYFNQVLPTLTAAMDDFHPQVQAGAASALCKFGVPIKSEFLMPYLDGIVNKLLVLLQSDKQSVQEHALDALACITRTFEEQFRTYYDTVMPHLRTVLKNADLKSNLILRARAIECISFVGFAVGKEKFRDDEKQVMEVVMSLQGLQVKADDPATNYMLRACTKVCQCMGQDFLPYMSAVMSFSIQCAQLEPSMTISVESDYRSDNSVEIVVLEDKTICSKRDVNLLEDKATACIMLCCCAATLKENFYPWISQAVSIFVPLLKFYTHNTVRRSAVRAMPILLNSAKLAVEKGIAQGGSESYFTKLSDHLILALIEALHEEHVTEICAVMLNELNNCLQICQPLLNEVQLRSIIDEIKHVITESSNRKRKFAERAKTEDFDDEEAELLKEEEVQEDNIFVLIGRILNTLIKTFKAAFLPFFDELSSYLFPMWEQDKTPGERCTSINILDQLVQECPEASIKYCDVFLSLLLDASNDENPEIRQNALYGLGLWAEYDRSSFKPFVREALSRINVVITHFRALEPQNESAYDNAVSAFGKIYQFHRESIDFAQVIPIWLNCLPIKADLAEAKYVHDELCSMVERLDREVLGPNYQYLPKIVSVFAEVLCSGDDLATEETMDRIINILRHLQQTLLPATFESAWLYILPQQEMELKSILSLEGLAFDQSNETPPVNQIFEVNSSTHSQDAISV